MAEEVIHKLTNPSWVAPQALSSVILCRNHGSNIKITDKISKSINHVTCPNCWELWKKGIYV